MSYFVIGDPDTVLGFKLAGVPGREAANAYEAREVLSAALSDEDNRIIMITEAVASLVRAEVDEAVLVGEFPLVVEIPDRKGAVRDRITVREWVRLAIGIQV